MTWCNTFNDVRAVENNLATAAAVAAAKKQQQASSHVNLIRTCPSCGHRAQYEQVAQSIHKYANNMFIISKQFFLSGS